VDGKAMKTQSENCW